MHGQAKNDRVCPAGYRGRNGADRTSEQERPGPFPDIPASARTLPVTGTRDWSQGSRWALHTMWRNGTDVFAGVVFGGMGLMKAGGGRTAAVQAVGREGDRDEREGKRRGGASVAGDDG